MECRIERVDFFVRHNVNIPKQFWHPKHISLKKEQTGFHSRHKLNKPMFNDPFKTQGIWGSIPRLTLISHQEVSQLCAGVFH